jgi:putative photosynthetic complex assembly protein 2
MLQYGVPVLYALFVWWFSTGLIIYLDGLPRSTYRWTMLGATAALGVACYGLVVSRSDTGIAGAYHAFTGALVVWGWLEASFLLGFLSGGRKEPCPPGCSFWRRFRLAAETVAHHELAIAAGAALVLALTWGGSNPVGPWTFLLLWGMRCSAKLNLFLGVPNLNSQFFPDHLRFLVSYLPKKPMNLFFPVSITASTALAVLLVQRAIAAEPAAATGLTLVVALLALAILEHWFLMLPVPDAALWSWAQRKTAADESGPEALPALPSINRR